MSDRSAELVRAVEVAEEHLKRADRLESALRGCWEEYHELMPDALYQQVKTALGLRIFEARLPKGREEDAASRRGGPAPSGTWSIPDPINDFTDEQRAALEASAPLKDLGDGGMGESSSVGDGPQ